MSVDALYTPLLIRYSKDERFSTPPSKNDLESYTSHKGNNPVCGDSIEWFVQVDNSIITDIRFKVEGCLISKASAGLLANLVVKKSIDYFFDKNAELKKLLSDKSVPHPTEDALNCEHWLSLAQVKSYQARQKCALLAWETLAKAIDNDMVY